MAVGEQRTELASRDGLRRASEACRSSEIARLVGSELIGIDHDDHVGTNTVIGRCFADPQGSGTELFEGISGALLRAAVLPGGIRASEGIECHPRVLGSSPVQQSGEREPAVSRVGGAESSLSVADPLILDGGLRDLPGEDRAGPSAEGDRVERHRERQELRFHRPLPIRRKVTQDAIDLPCVLRADGTVGESIPGRRVPLSGSAGIDLTLGVRRGLALLVGQLALVVPELPTELARTLRLDASCLRRGRCPGPQGDELRDGPPQPTEELLEAVIGEFADVERSSRFDRLLDTGEVVGGPRLTGGDGATGRMPVGDGPRGRGP